MILLVERSAGEPEGGPTQATAQRLGEQAPVVPESRPVTGRRVRTRLHPAQQSLRSPRSLRPPRLYRLSQSQPGPAISLALGPVDPVAILAGAEAGSRDQEQPAGPPEVPEPGPAPRNEAIQRSARHLSRGLGQLLRFVITGGLNTLIDILVLNALVWLLAVRSTPLLLTCNIVAYCAGAVNSFLLNKYWTFGRREPITRGELLRFALITVGGSLWSSGILWLAGLALEHILINPTLWTNAAKIIAIGGTALISYLGLRLWVFVQGRPGLGLRGMGAQPTNADRRYFQWKPWPIYGTRKAHDSDGHGPATVTPHEESLWKRKGPETL